MTVKTPNLTNVRAILTTRWGNSGYRPHNVRTVETYYVDTALDNDADIWQIEVGDPDGDMVDMLRRDSEIRVQLYGYSPSGSEPIMTGLADEINFSEEGKWAITGRDLSSLAMDSTVPPTFFKQVKAYSLVRRQALNLGFQKTNLATGLGGQVIVKKTQYTDGNESYWEFWYRLYRKEKMWLWTEPDGTLVGANLNYSGPPFYYFGRPRTTDSRTIKSQFIPIEHVAVSKGVTKRFEEIWVYWHHGDNGKITKRKDPAMRDWQKRPFKIVQDSDARTENSAVKTALDEIFEGKVGELEYKIVVPDPGHEIHQNRIARLSIPEVGIDTEMFIVGVKRSGGPDGVVLEIRLRERHYAITSRVPKDPKVESNRPGPTGTTGLTNDLPGILSGIPHPEWTNYFLASAKKHSGAWDFDLFLATLIGICDQETGGRFVNIRRNGGPGGSGIEWYKWHGKGSDSPNRPPGTRDPYGRTLEEWKTLFANEKGDGYVTEDYAVGPMQLLSSMYTDYADNLLKAGDHDEWFGGRWTPEYNIDGGGFALIDKLNNSGLDPGNDTNIWVGVANYGEGAAYAQSVKSKVVSQGGYLQQVKDSRAQAIADAAVTQDPGGDAGDSGPFPFNNSPNDLKKLKNISNPSGADITHVNYVLLSRLNAWGKAGGKTVQISTSDGGFRSKAQQQALWDGAPGNGLIRGVTVADPSVGSNHQRGEACDCLVDGQAMGLQSRVTLSKYKIWANVWVRTNNDPVHMTRIEVTG